MKATFGERGTEEKRSGERENVRAAVRASSRAQLLPWPAARGDEQRQTQPQQAHSREAATKGGRGARRHTQRACGGTRGSQGAQGMLAGRGRRSARGLPHLITARCLSLKRRSLTAEKVSFFTPSGLQSCCGTPAAWRSLHSCLCGPFFQSSSWQAAEQ